MAIITYTQLQGVRDAMAMLDDRTRARIAEVILRVGTESPDALRDAILDELAPVMEQASAIAAEMSAAVFNGFRLQALGLEMDTVTQTAYEVGKVHAVANTAAKKAAEGATVDEIVSIVFSRAAYDMRKSYGETMLENVRRDKSRPRFARIPGPSEHYANGCPFCRMLASRDFVYWSRKTAGEFNHYHADCTCQVVSSWDKSPIVEGYDPSAYYEEYLDARQYAKDNKAEIRRRRGEGTAGAIDAHDISAASRDLGLAPKLK